MHVQTHLSARVLRAWERRTIFNVAGEVVALVVQPALALVAAAVRPEPAFRVVLAEALAVRGGGDVLHVQDLVLVPVAGAPPPELILAWQVSLAVVTVL